METPEPEPEIYGKSDARSFFSSIFLFALIFSLLSLLSSCSDPVDEAACGSTLATVRDYSGLDGCGWVLVKDNGEVLEPYFPPRCGNDSFAEGPQIDARTLRNGLRVRIGYEVMEDMASVCMAGKIVKVYCIEELPATTYKD